MLIDGCLLEMRATPGSIVAPCKPQRINFLCLFTLLFGSFILDAI